MSSNVRDKLEQKIIYTLLLGSNLGDTRRYLAAGTELLEKYGRLLGASSIQESKAWGNTNQADFVNQILLLESDLEPFEMLDAIHDIEDALERTREEKWGPRTLDIDILYAENLMMETETLTIPHPLIAERMFTLVLLNEIAPDFVDPKTGKTCAEMLQALRMTS